MIGSGKIGPVSKGTTETITPNRPKVFKDHQGVPVFEIDYKGNWYPKGSVYKLRPRS